MGGGNSALGKEFLMVDFSVGIDIDLRRVLAVTFFDVDFCLLCFPFDCSAFFTPFNVFLVCRTCFVGTVGTSLRGGEIIVAFS